MKKRCFEGEWTDPDDALKLTGGWSDQADLNREDKLIRQGPPKATNPKEAVNIQLDSDVRDYSPRV